MSQTLVVFFLPGLTVTTGVARQLRMSVLSVSKLAGGQHFSSVRGLRRSVLNKGNANVLGRLLADDRNRCVSRTG